jgi:type IV pilus assembly protein PilC
MATVFEWTGKNSAGESEKGELTAESREAVQLQLQGKGITPTMVKPKEKKKFSFGGGGKATDKDIVVFTRQFSVMIDAGLPLVQALDVISGQAENPVMRRVLSVIKNDVEGGATFADALKKHPNVFTDLYANMVAAGEAGGILDTILNRLAAYMEKAAKLKRQIKSAMVYPITISSIAVFVVSIILIVVVPVFQDMFNNLGGTLPIPTQIVVFVSDFMKNYWWAIGITVFSLMTAFKKFRKTERGHYMTDALALKIPIMGNLIRKVSVSKFTRTMGTLTSSGVPILEGLEITARTSGNKVIERAVLQVKAAVSEGKTLAEPLKASKVFPDMVVHMIAIGEQTGALDTFL